MKNTIKKRIIIYHYIQFVLHKDIKSIIMKKRVHVTHTFSSRLKL